VTGRHRKASIPGSLSSFRLGFVAHLHLAPKKNDPPKRIEVRGSFNNHV